MELVSRYFDAMLKKKKTETRLTYVRNSRSLTVSSPPPAFLCACTGCKFEGNQQSMSRANDDPPFVHRRRSSLGRFHPALGKKVLVEWLTVF